MEFRAILEYIQQHVVESFGYRDVNALRTAFSRFPDDPIIREAFYSKCLRSFTTMPMIRFDSVALVKHNKITQGLVNQGQSAIDVPLYSLDGEATTLFKQMHPDHPLIIFAGSTT